MIFASKKVVCIVLLQFLFIIVNNVNSSPPAREDVDVNTKKKGILFNQVNCFGIHNGLFKLLKLSNTKAEDVKFYFASRRKPDYMTVTIQNNTAPSLKNVEFDPYNDTVLISHGFMSSGKGSWLRDMKDALLKYDKKAYNVIIVDWEAGSNTWNYVKAAVSTEIVGKQIAQLFYHMRIELKERDIPIKKLGKIHFVGHSLGAHIVAHAANEIKKNQSSESAENRWIVNRITGLDPAQPCFVLVGKDQKLDETDAEFVDVIHTNAEKPLVIGFGMPERLGHMDFYPNGGKMQIGCERVETSIWSHLALPVHRVKEAICSHGRSHDLFTESIMAATSGECTFISHPWHDQKSASKELLQELLLGPCVDSSCPEMGINAIDSFPREGGIFFTATGHKSPYCIVTDADKEMIEAQLKSRSFFG